MKWVTKCFFSILLIAASLQSQTQLPSFFGDNMVLQQKEKVAIWGNDIPNSEISIATSWGENKTATTNSKGNWKTYIQTKKASFTPQTISIKGTSSIILKNVLIGEVWFCSGQSNMDMPMDGLGKSKVLNADTYLKKSINKNIRLFNVPRTAAVLPSLNVKAKWQQSTEESAKKFSAIGYIFGLNLFENLNVPIGIIESAWGGTRIESWIPKEDLEKYRDVKIPTQLSTIQQKQKRPTFLYNGMIHPFQDFKIKGFLWYQGESNRTKPEPYKSYMEDLISSWRLQWKNDKLPFYFVQIAPFNYVKYKKGKENYANFIREAQLETSQNIKNTGLVVTSDLGDCNDIHPSKKGEVADRLSNWALANQYNLKELSFRSGELKSFKINDNEVSLQFQFYNNDHFIKIDNVKGFAIAGADKIFYPANVVFHKNGKQISLLNQNVKKPIAVRYGFEACFESNLVTKSGLPISVFRTDKWEN